MPPKAKVPAPIDRPLSRAYMREFTGWSTAYPPGISEPTSLRSMENVMINRDGSARVRPGLRYLSFAGDGIPIPNEPVGSHEAFFLNDGTKAYLFAVREDDNTVGFRVLVPTSSPSVKQLTDISLGFDLPAIPNELNFTEATTYVKYLQIDNKIFALSNAGEVMRLFHVGEAKSAKLLNSIERPAWTSEDKLSVVHPEAAWINSGDPISTRINLLANPSAETNTLNWSPNAAGIITRTDEVGPPGDGSYVFKLESRPERTNLMPYTLEGPVGALTGWGSGTGTGGGPGEGTFTVNAGWARISLPPTVGFIGYANGPAMTAEAGKTYRAAFDVQVSAQPINVYVLFRFYNSAGVQIGGDTHVVAGESGRTTTAGVTAPSGTTSMRIFVRGQAENNFPCWVDFRNVLVAESSEATAYFDGSNGANYFWTGAANASASVYHPPRDVQAWSSSMQVTAGEDYNGSVYVRAGSTARNVFLAHAWYTAADVFMSSDNSAVVANSVGAWTRRDNTEVPPTVPQDPLPPLVATKASFVITIQQVPRGEAHYFDAGLFEQATVVDTYFDGSTASTSTLAHGWSGTPHGSWSAEVEKAAPEAVPTAETKTANTLISSTAASNIYNFGFFYVFSNDVGDSAASQVTVVKTQRGWSQWKWETPNVSGEPSGTATNDPLLCADQLVATMPQSAFDEAIAAGATKWKLYMLTWSDTDPVPVTAVKVAERKLDGFSLYGSAGWLQATPQQIDASAETSVLPNETTRYNYSNPSRGGQGLVAADRMILVNDPTAQAVIRWSSNQQGEYTNFSANKGGGYKTLTSGNLFVPAVVKLWQNPQSIDTLTILCLGVDDYSTGYYMAPAQVASQSEATNVMGFEETTATPGTVSPFGCEVLNNALYHPLDEMLMKSTANNYNINHASVTDVIQNSWRRLQFKNQIVSSHHDNRLYYLVFNPDGAALEEGCWGNEIWVLDAAQKQGTWSRWLVQGQSLRKMEQGGQVVMSLVRPDGIYYFDEDYPADDFVDGDTTGFRSIPWFLETNTQGANRAHDAWAHLKQATITLGNFQGKIEWGVRGWDLHGKAVDRRKITQDHAASGDGPWDRDDHLQVDRQLKEWFFFAGSVTEDGEVQESYGQINYLQYRYAPISVNVGYEYGSVETFDYARAVATQNVGVAPDGVPSSYIDLTRP